MLQCCIGSDDDFLLVAAELALNLDQKIADGWALRAKALSVKGEPLRARSSASRALELDPTNLEYAKLLLSLTNI